MVHQKTRWKEEAFPNTTLSIDPGASYPGRKTGDLIPYAGVGKFQWGTLCWVGLVKCPVQVDKKTVAPFARPSRLVQTVCAKASVARTDKHLGEPLSMLAVENPVIYAKSKARPSDIMALKGIYGAFMGGIDAEFYSGPTPGEWKANIDPEIMCERILKVLNSYERDILVDAQKRGEQGLSHHVIDAVGIGLFALGRMGRGGEI